MGLLSMIVGLPFAPVKGVIAIGEIIRRQVEQELTNPAAVRARLEEIERRRRAGLISEEEEARAQQEVLDRLIRPAGPDQA